MHTKGTWETGKKHPCRVIAFNNGISSIVAMCCDSRDEGTERQEEKDNAQFIVRACNCHDELLEACKQLLIETDQHAQGDCPKLLSACAEARKAIAKAEGK